MAAKVQNKAETFTFVFSGVIEKEAASPRPKGKGRSRGVSSDQRFVCGCPEYVSGGSASLWFALGAARVAPPALSL